jgi:autotransporter-associated beta strand protein
LTVTGGINVGNPNGSTNSTANFRMDGGTVNVSGPIQIGLNNLSRWSIVDVNGGTLVDSDTTSGIQIGNPSAGNAEFLVRAGVANVQLVTFGQGGVADTVTLNLIGGKLFVGSGGMVQGSLSATPGIFLGGGTLGATAPWSSSLNMSLSGTATIRAGDPIGNPQNISLSGNLSGSGALTLAGVGAGELILSGSNTYTGGTIVTGGELVVSSPASVLDGSNLMVGNPGAFPAPIIPSPAVSSAPAAAAIAPVPEPGALALLAAGAAVAGCLWKRTRKARGKR